MGIPTPREYVENMFLETDAQGNLYLPEVCLPTTDYSGNEARRLAEALAIYRFADLAVKLPNPQAEAEGEA